MSFFFFLVRAGLNSVLLCLIVKPFKGQSGDCAIVTAHLDHCHLSVSVKEMNWDVSLLSVFVILMSHTPQTTSVAKLQNVLAGCCCPNVGEAAVRDECHL